MSTSTSHLSDDAGQLEVRAGGGGRGRSIVAWLVGLGVIGGLGGWGFVRVRTAQAQQATLAAERETQLQTAIAQSKVATPLETVMGVPRVWKPVVPLEGSLQPAREVELGFKVPGRMNAVAVKMGEHIRAGTSLASLDTAEAQAQVKAAEAQVRAGEAQLAMAADSAKRTTALVASGSAPQANAVATGQQRALAEAQLDAAKAQLALAQAQLHNMALVSPFAGIVTRAPTGAGSIVSPMVPLFRITDTATLRLAGTIGEGDAGLVKVGAPVTVEIDDRKVLGRVSAVLPTLDAQTRRVPVEAEIRNDGPAPLLAGTFVRARVDVQTAGDTQLHVLALPASTLRPGAQDEVMIVKEGRLVARHLAFTRAADGVLLVRAGLQPGEKVLLTPSAEAKDGDLAQLAPTAAATPTATPTATVNMNEGGAP